MPALAPPAHAQAPARDPRERRDHRDPRALRVLVVGDDPAGRAAVSRGLASQGWQALTAADGLQALRALGEHDVDAVVLDAVLPLVDGLETCRRLRAAGNDVPVLLLHPSAGVEERVAGLDAGADDCLSGPAAMREVVARLRAITRRTRRGTAAADGPRAIGDLRVDRAAHRAWRADRALDLTRTEFLLLDRLAQDAGAVVSRSELLLSVWGYDPGPESNCLGVYVGYLRRKTEAGGEPRLLHTVRGVGYTLRAD